MRSIFIVLGTLAIIIPGISRNCNKGALSRFAPVLRAQAVTRTASDQALGIQRFRSVTYNWNGNRLPITAAWGSDATYFFCASLGYKGDNFEASSASKFKDQTCAGISLNTNTDGCTESASVAKSSEVQKCLTEIACKI